MNGKNVWGDDLKLFEKIKQDAIKDNFVYDLETYKQDVQKFHDKIKEAWQVHDLIETRIHVNTDSSHFGDINKGFGTSEHPFWAWEHVKDGLVKAYYATQRHPVR